MKFSVGAVKFFNGLISGLGSLLVLIGFFPLNSINYIFLAAGIIMVVVSEGINLYITKHEEPKERAHFKQNFLQNLGASYAFPVLVFVFYLLSRNAGVLPIAIIFAGIALIRTVGILAKGQYIDRM